MHLNRIAAIILATGLCICASAQKVPVRNDFNVACDSLSARLQRRTGVTANVKIKKLVRRESEIDFYFDKEFSDWPWRTSDYSWLRSELSTALSEVSPSFSLGRVYANGVAFEELATPVVGNGGKPGQFTYRQHDPRLANGSRFILRKGARHYSKGLSDRYIALWQSHGRYWNEEQGKWIWQRAQLHRTVEDMYTQSYVLPYLMPMLENAGAYVMTPRERDPQIFESICDNDPAFKEERGELVRQKGYYRESGRWDSAGEGFADRYESYRTDQNPFKMGTARMAECSAEAEASARWTPSIQERGTYAVYVSYASLDSSTEEAHYTVSHLGGQTEFTVNQKRGGGTWIYLGSFEFAPEWDNFVELSNEGKEGCVVTADAVRFGGGMGKVRRGGSISGMPAFAEGALYSMSWSGADSTIWTEWPKDYTRDYAGRGGWVKEQKDSRHIPFDMSLAFHSDAGLTPNDSIVGTLSIYTLKCDGKRNDSNGYDRMGNRRLADFVQTQVVNDIRADWDPEWSRRGLWDRSYSESRTTDVPGMILELLSHQNFADMKYGLDPGFRFTVSRAVYKGVLKFLSDLYACPYEVQPLPVSGFSVQFGEDGISARLRWVPVEDEKEPTAKPKGYTVYTRIDGGGWDAGTDCEGTACSLPITEGHIYSYKVSAWNDGGESFPSEILSLGTPSGVKPDSTNIVLVVNNFDRVAAPVWADTEEFAGFNGKVDSGVPYLCDYSYIGENYEFRRGREWVTDDDPGHGASWDDYAGRRLAGNSFDYPFVHGKALMGQGRCFCSMSRDAFCTLEESGTAPAFDIVDLICGKQVSTLKGTGRKGVHFEVFPKKLQEAIGKVTEAGTDIIISGAYIATDAWDSVYPTPTRIMPRTSAQGFIKDVLGYKYVCTFGTSAGAVTTATGQDSRFLRSKDSEVRELPFHSMPNEDCYCVETPGAIAPADLMGKTVLRYAQTLQPAAVVYKGKGYKVFSIGVPIETFKKESDINYVMSLALKSVR